MQPYAQLIHASLSSKNPSLYVEVLEPLLYTLSLCQVEHENILILDINDQYTRYLFAFKGLELHV
jgi:hypothetical protein